MLKLADFGLCNRMRDGASLQTSCGSPNYAAPEVIDGSPYDGASADVWSCGVILYAILTGTLPFESDSIADLFSQIKNSDYLHPSELSNEAQELISLMLTSDPDKRIKTRDVLRHPWYFNALLIANAFCRVLKGCVKTNFFGKNRKISDISTRHLDRL